VVPSSSLVPGNDPTLLFTNAGMVQFKDVFLGKEARDYSRAATAQRCVRAGGKHNDLGKCRLYGPAPHVFRDAGQLQLRRLLQARGDPLCVELRHRDAGDSEGPAVGHGVQGRRRSATHLDRGDRHRSHALHAHGREIQFLVHGRNGPCGPCTEIFYDHGAEIPGGPPGSPDEDGDRYVEIWNLVFMQYDRSADGVLVPLPKPSVDTGMGLERVAAVMQGVHSNYDIDLFKSLIRAAAEVTGTQDLESSSLRVIADHIRACTFLIIDGVVPSNEGRGYVLRRIIRRAIRHGYKLGQTQPFFHQAGAELVREMGAYYAELVAARRARRKFSPRKRIDLPRRWRPAWRCSMRRAAKLKSSVIPGRNRVPSVRHVRVSARSDGRRGARARPDHRSGGIRRRDGSAARPRARRQQVRRGAARCGQAAGKTNSSDMID
jgi:alanyl-tRNA synthetase